MTCIIEAIISMSGTARALSIRLVIAAVISLTLPCVVAADDRTAQVLKHAFRRPSKPNIVYILADDAGYGDLGCYGQADISTPCLDRMASEGTRFTRHYAGAPVCAPSRCSFLTGFHTGHTPVRGNWELLPEGQMPLPEGTRTIAHILSEQGYETAVIGKWGLGGPGSSGEPNRMGFDHWFGYLCQRQAHSYYPDHLWRNGTRVDLDGTTYTHDLFTDEAMQWVSDHRKGPFFLYLAYTIPHANLEVPETAPYTERDWPDEKKRYAAMMTRLDRDVGRILDLIADLGIEDNTLIIFTSDNGPHGEGGYHPSFFRSAGPLRGMKRDLYEGGIRVPMIARWPGTVPAGRVSGHVSAFWDMMPTFAELAGAVPPGQSDGISMVRELTGRIKLQKRHDALYWEFHEQGGRQALLSGRWKAVRHDLRMRPGSLPELYDLAADPGEEKNIAEDNPDTAARLGMLMNEMRTESSEFPLVGKMKYGFQLFNGWLISAAYVLLWALFLIPELISNRPKRDTDPGRKAALSRGLSAAAGASTAALVGLPALLPLWFGTPLMSAGLAVAGAGITGYSAARLYRLIRGRKPFALKGPGRFIPAPVYLFSLLFFTGIGIATASCAYLLLVLAVAALRVCARVLEGTGTEMQAGT